MSYASDLGLKVGSKIKVIAPNGGNSIYEDGHVLMLREDDRSKNPIFRNLTTGDDTCCFTITERSNGTTWEHYKEEAETSNLKFPCCVATSEIKDEETFQKILSLFVANGVEVSDRLFSSKENWNWFGVDVNDLTTEYYNSVGSYAMDYEENDVTVYTVEQLLAFLPKEEAPVAQTITLLPIGTEVKIAETSGYYGGEKDTSNPKDTKGTIFDLDGDDGLCYIVRWENGKRNSYGLNDLVRWEETPSVASQEAITERLEDNPSAGIDYSVMGTTASTDPLIIITQEVKYTVVIKGITFTLTQGEIDELAEELLGFTTL